MVQTILSQNTSDRNSSAAFANLKKRFPRWEMVLDAPVASIERAIIDKNARIGGDVEIRSHEGEEDHHEELYSVRDGIVVIPDNSVIPDGTVV